MVGSPTSSSHFDAVHQRGAPQRYETFKATLSLKVHAMRALALLAAGLIALGPPAAAAPPATQTGAVTTLTLLGAGSGPGGRAARAGIASLVTVRGHRYLVDAGEGVARQIAAAGLSERDIAVVFFTHLHDDHTVGLPGLMSFFYTLRGEAMQLVGPPGTAALLQGALAFLQPNADLRAVENHMTRRPGEVFSAREVEPGVVYMDDQVTVTAVENTHYRLSAAAFSTHQRSYAFRFQSPDKVIVFTGDTGDSVAVEKLAAGADILVAEMVSAADAASVPESLHSHIVAEHLSPTQVGQMAARTKVKMLVLSHIQQVSEADIAELRRWYSGPLAVGRDLDRF